MHNQSVDLSNPAAREEHLEHLWNRWIMLPRDMRHEVAQSCFCYTLGLAEEKLKEEQQAVRDVAICILEQLERALDSADRIES